VDRPGDLFYRLLQSKVAIATVGVGVPALAAAAFVRLIPWWLFFVLLLIVIVSAVAFLALRQWWANRKDARLEQGLDAQTSKDIGRQRVRDREALKDLQTKWKQSVETLRKSRIGRRRRPLYFLPWYAIIGAPQCGKSTAIKNSGLHFPMGEPKLAGTGGTRNCDWWFAEEAIILDTAGRYTFGDEHEPDRDEWFAFLRLLRKYRPGEPLNGLIVAVSADVLMAPDEAEVVNHARGIRHKIDQLVRELGIQFPIYLLLTKCDLIEGFTDFFGRLPKKRLDELLGWTSASWEVRDPRALVGGALDELRRRILQLRIIFLQEEERTEPLRRIYLFPDELGALARNLVEFCDVLFRETQYNESPFLRGIYLTSGMQKGTAVSRMLDRLGLRAQAQQLREEQRSYFLKDFFQTRLGADRRLVSTTGRARGRLQVVHNLGFFSAVAACAVVALLTFGSYVANRTLLNQLQDEMEAAIGPEESAPAERVAALSRYVDALERLEERNRRRPLRAGFGLYTGYRAIEPARALFLRQFAADAYTAPVESARRALRARDAEIGFPALEALVRNYVLSVQLNGTGAVPPGPNEALVYFWADRNAVDEEVRDAYSRGYFAFLRWRPAAAASAEQQTDQALIREALPELFTVERVAAWADRFYRPFRAVDIPVPAVIANDAAVRGAFTAPAWKERVAPLADAVDLVARDFDPQLTTRFRQEYLGRYHRDWLQFLMRPRDSVDGSVSMTALLGEQCPYLAVVDSTARGVDIGEAARPPWATTVVRASGERAAYLTHLQAVARAVRAAEDDPQAAFEDARQIFTRRTRLAGDGGDPAAAPADPFGKAEHWVETTVGAGAAADAEDAQVRTRLSALLRAPVYAAFGAYLRVVALEVDRQWRRKVSGQFMGASTPADLQQLYGSNGVLWEFYRVYLDPFFEREASFTPKVRYTKSLPFDPSLAPYLRNAEGRAKRLFGSGGGMRQYPMMVQSVPSGDAGEVRATRTVLTVFCGQGEAWRLEHRQFRISRQLVWSPETCNRTELQVFVGTPGSGGLGDERPLDPIVYEGPMGWVNFLRSASRRGDEFSWSFAGNITASFIINVPRDLFALVEGGAPPASIVR
jgi:type VI secretion system protein ImpL